MANKFKFNIITGENAGEKYAALPTKEPFTFYLLQTGAGYLGTVKLFDASESHVMSGKFFRAVSSHIITQDDLNNENVNVPEGTEVGTVGMLFTADTDQEDNDNETFYFLPVQFKKVETVNEINHENPSDKIPTEAAVVNYVIQMLADKVSFEIDGVPGGNSDDASDGGENSTRSDTPIGTIISFMGTSAPNDYLVCDGAEYNIEDYPDLANHFATHFESVNYFGGDGETTFAVPDLRNLFLRGYHEDAEEKASGNIGERQAPTLLPYYFSSTSNDTAQFTIMNNAPEILLLKNSDKVTDAVEYATHRTRFSGTVLESAPNSERNYLATRPVNMAVLFCIRATKPIIIDENQIEEYDTNDGWHVRKWASGYVEMILHYESTTEGKTFTPIGNQYHMEDVLPKHNYPVPLIKRYSEIGTGLLDYTAIFFQIGMPTDRQNATLRYNFMRPTDTMVNTNRMEITIVVTGKWK